MCGDEINRQAVVGHVAPEIGIRPVDAPKHAIGKRLNDAPGERTSRHGVCSPFSAEGPDTDNSFGQLTLDQTWDAAA
jgi:hypothetical protein